MNEEIKTPEVTEVPEATEVPEKNETPPDIESRIKNAVEKFARDFENRLDKMQKETSLQQLSDEERQKQELQDLREELTAKTKELERRELEITTSKVLAERKIPSQFLDFLMDADAERTLNRIKEFESVFKKAIETAVDEKLKSSSKPMFSGNMNLEGGGKKLAEIIRSSQIRF